MLAQRFLVALSASGKSRSTLASECGVTPMTISHWARGRSTPRPVYLPQIARSLGVTVDWLTDAQPFKPMAGRAAVTGITPLALRLRVALAYGRVTQRDLAAACGVSIVTVGHWLNGRYFPPEPTVRKIAEAIGAPYAWLSSPEHLELYRT